MERVGTRGLLKPEIKLCLHMASHETHAYPTIILWSMTQPETPVAFWSTRDTIYTSSLVTCSEQWYVVHIIISWFLKLPPLQVRWKQNHTWGVTLSSSKTTKIEGTRKREVSTTWTLLSDNEKKNKQNNFRSLLSSLFRYSLHGVPFSVCAFQRTNFLPNKNKNLLEDIIFNCRPHYSLFPLLSVTLTRHYTCLCFLNYPFVYKLHLIHTPLIPPPIWRL